MNVTEPRKHWLLDGEAGGPNDQEGGFINRHGPFQSSLTEGKAKAAAAAAAAAGGAGVNSRPKKPTGILKGIGHMFRFGRHRKDGIAPVTESHSDLGSAQQRKQLQRLPLAPTATASEQGQPIYQTRSAALLPSASASDLHRPPGGPPNYQPPPPVSANVIGTDATFNQRYSQSLYVNHGELQQLG